MNNKEFKQRIRDAYKTLKSFGLVYNADLLEDTMPYVDIMDILFRKKVDIKALSLDYDGTAVDGLATYNKDHTRITMREFLALRKWIEDNSL